MSMTLLRDRLISEYSLEFHAQDLIRLSGRAEPKVSKARTRRYGRVAAPQPLF